MERGRPRSFNEETVLDAALNVFWRCGFQNASLSELTKATGLSKPSLYGAFGDKKSLYLRALQRYVAFLSESCGKELRDEKNSKQAVKAYLTSMSRMLTDPALPGGCFIVTGTADFGGPLLPPDVEDALKQAFSSSEALLTEHLRHAKTIGDLPESADPERLASLLLTLIAGLAVQAKNGAPESKLKDIVQTAMAVWPTV